MMALMLVAAALNGAFLFALVACVGTLTLTALGVTERPHYPAQELTIAVGIAKAALCWLGTRILAPAADEAPPHDRQAGPSGQSGITVGPGSWQGPAWSQGSGNPSGTRSSTM